MRIIAGRARGRTLLAPDGRSTRPTPDRVREALFSMLGPYLADSRVLDLYAGSGALGLEALSRGAATCTFVEHDDKALKCLRRNIATLADCTEGRCRTLCCSVASACARLEKRAFDLVLMDPPYKENLVTPTLHALLASDIVSAAGLLICEHSSKQILATVPKHLKLWRQKSYGEVSFTIFQHD